MDTETFRYLCLILWAITLMLLVVWMGDTKSKPRVPLIPLPDWRVPDNMLLIGLSGKKGAGKDTVADLLEDRWSGNVRVVKIAFADALKEACMAIFGLTRRQVYGDLKEVVDPFWGVTPRYILQVVGTNCLRNHYASNLWVAAALRRIMLAEAADGEHVIVFLTDVRFRNEANIVREWGGSVWRIQRDSVTEAENARRAAGESIHISETDLDAYAFETVIENNLSMDALTGLAERHLEEALPWPV